MRRMPILVVLIYAWFACVAQNAEPVPLSFRSSAQTLGVTASGRFVITTRAGEVALCGRANEPWERRDPKSVDGVLGGPLLDQGNFFNQDTGFVSGFIHDDKLNYNLIYRTTDGGKHWQALNFGQSGWVDDAVNLENGEAWMSVAGSGIAYTQDYGLTWKKRKNPEVRQRYASIFYNQKREGLVGSLFNSLAVTRDNCGTWTFLPTPLDQKAYQKTNLQSRPEFSRVALYKGYYLVVQEGLLFFSPQDTVQWTLLPGYSDVYTDAENSALYLRTEKGGIVRAGDDLRPLHTYKVLLTGGDAKCKSGSLYVLSESKVHQFWKDGEVQVSLVATTDLARVQPEVVGYTTLGALGRWADKVYYQSGFEGEWRYQFTLPAAAREGRLSVVDQKWLLVHSPTDSLLYFDFSGKLLRTSSVAQEVKAFQSAGISKLVFAKGSQGCFHRYEARATYAMEGGSFVLQTPDPVLVGSSRPPKELLREGSDEISGRLVDAFRDQLLLLFDESKTVTIQDLNFTAGDYEQCKRDILSFQAALAKGKQPEKGFSFPRNNLHFERLLHLVDTIEQLSSQTLHLLLTGGDGIWSTTTNWTKLELVNGRNEVLHIESLYYEAPPYFFPWRVTLNGCTVLSSNMAINRFLEQVYPGFLASTSKVKVLYQLIRALYD